MKTTSVVRSALFNHPIYLGVALGACAIAIILLSVGAFNAPAAEHADQPAIPVFVKEISA